MDNRQHFYDEISLLEEQQRQRDSKDKALEADTSASSKDLEILMRGAGVVNPRRGIEAQQYYYPTYGQRMKDPSFDWGDCDGS